MSIKSKKLIFRVLIVVLLLCGIVFSRTFLFRRNQNQESTAEATTNTTIEKPSQNNSTMVPTEQYQLLIDKIGVEASININTDGNNQAKYDKALESGVAHLKGSALPGSSGNVFIFGHSSYYANKPGNYKQVFAKLNDLGIGDLITIRSQSVSYVYKISNKRTVKASDVSVADQNFALKQITLMTCWPIGSTAERLVAVGELVE